MAYATADQLGSFSLGDTPILPVVLSVFDDEDYRADLDGLNATATLNGVSLQVTVQDDQLIIVLPYLSVAGVNRLRVSLGGQALAPISFVVEPPTEWLTIEDARDRWRDATASDVELYELLESARVQCEAFAPTLPENIEYDEELPLVGSSPHRVPIHYRHAQLMQARNMWNAAKVDPKGHVGADGFAVTIFPMDWAVKALLRPKRGKPVIG